MHQVPKNKLPAQKPCYPGGLEPDDLVISPISVLGEAEFELSSSSCSSCSSFSSSFPPFQGICYYSLPKTFNNPHSCRRAPSASTTALADSCTRSDVDAYKKVKDKTRSTKVTKRFNSEPIDDETVMSLVHYLMYKYKMNESITETDFLRGMVDTKEKLFLKIMKKVSDCLEIAYGLDLRTVGPRGCTYVVRNKLGPHSDTGVNTGLLLTILGVIFTNGDCVTEKQIWELLNTMGLYDGKDHYIFGDTRKLITEELVQKQYLQYRQVPNSDPPLCLFLWGARAHTEISKMQVLEFYAKCLKTTPRAYPLCYKKALRDQEERTRARIKARIHIDMAKARSRTIYSYCNHRSRI